MRPCSVLKGSGGEGGPEGWEAERERGGAWAWRGQRRSMVSGGSSPAVVHVGGGVVRATVKGDGVGATRNGVVDRWVGMQRGPGRQRLGAARGSAVRRSTWCWQVGPAAQCARFGFQTESNRNKFISNGFKLALNFDRSKMCLLVLQKLQIKYGWKEIEIRNNSSYRNFSRFKNKFELKFRELLWVEIH
jgi:hypothetical protein